MPKAKAGDTKAPAAKPKRADPPAATRATGGKGGVKAKGKT